MQKRDQGDNSAFPPLNRFPLNPLQLAAAGDRILSARTRGLLHSYLSGLLICVVWQRFTLEFLGLYC